MHHETVIVGIGGASGSGKSSLSRALQAKLGQTHCAVLEMDAYYHDLKHLDPEERALRNFDDPSALDVGLLLEQLDLLRRGEQVLVPTYDFVTHTRVAPGQMFGPAPVLLVEGIFCLASAPLRCELDWSVFISTPAGVCLERRVARDTQSRGRTEDQARLQYATTVRPAAERIVIPSARYADRIVGGTNPLDAIVDRVIGDVQRLAVRGAATGARGLRRPRLDGAVGGVRS